MLYIRHGEKMYANGKAEDFRMDPPLTMQGKIDALNKFKELLKKYGPPPVIVCSPFLRARETARIAKNVIFLETGESVEIIYNASIGEYLGNHENVNATDLYPETLKYNPILKEDMKEFIYRVNNHVSVEAWFITHGIFIQKLASKLGHKIKYPSNLEGFYLKNNKLDLIES